MYHHHHHGYGGRVPPAVAKPHQSMVSQVYDPPFYKVANPGPLGLISFALTTFVLGLYQCGAGLVFYFLYTQPWTQTLIFTDSPNPTLLAA